MTISSKQKDILQQFLISFIAVLLSLIVGAVIILAMGYNPISAYGALIKGSMGSLVSLTMTLKTSVPLILAGLAVAVAFKSSAFNIGVEGQLMFGGLCAGLVGIYVPLPGPLHLAATILAGMLGGALIAFFPAILNSSCNVSVVISTIMLFAGIYGFITRRNMLAVLISIELILNSVDINFVAFNRFLYPEQMEGFFFTLFAIGISACETAVAIAIIINVYRNIRNIQVRNLDKLKD